MQLKELIEAAERLPAKDRVRLIQRVAESLVSQPDLSQYEPLEPQVSDEELERRARSIRWSTTFEVLAHLRVS